MEQGTKSMRANREVSEDKIIWTCAWLTFLFFILRLHASRQPIEGAGCETNTIAQSSNNQSAKIGEIVLPQVAGLSRPHPLSKTLPPGKML